MMILLYNIYTRENANILKMLQIVDHNVMLYILRVWTVQFVVGTHKQREQKIVNVQ